MAAVNKIDSNATGLSYAEETSLGTLPGTPEWYELEPNSYEDFGGEITTVARNPINDSRQRKKGVLTDLDSSGGFNTDLTQENLQDMLQGFMYADAREKGTEEPTAVTATTDLYSVASTTGFQVNDLISATGFSNAANNVTAALVTAVVASTSVEVINETLVTEGSPPAGAKIFVVGHQAGSADIDVDASGILPTYTSTTLDFTTLGLIPGEWIFVGGDGASEDFVNAANNGWKRIKSISANALEIDKSDGTMVTETGTGLTIRFFFGKVLKNEADPTLQVRRTYNLERTLGAPDDASPSQIQSEYVEGAVPSEWTMNIESADKITADLSFVGTSYSTRTGVTGVKSGNRNAVTEADAFNTSSDFSRIKLATVTATDEAPTALFAFAQSITLNINNNLTPNKAVGTLGSFDVTAGTFEVSGDITAYFANTTATQAVQDNSSITLDIAVAKNNAGLVIDLPYITLGEGRLEVEQDEPVTLPLSMDAATAAAYDANMDHTLMMVFFAYLPTAAE